MTVHAREIGGEETITCIISTPEEIPSLKMLYVKQDIMFPELCFKPKGCQVALGLSPT